MLLEELAFHSAVHKELEFLAENLFEVQVSDNFNLDDFEDDDEPEWFLKH
jgi:hypothetical protein